MGRDFLEEPFDVNVTLSQPVLIPCKISSFPKATVTWERDNAPLPQNTTRYVTEFVLFFRAVITV